MVSLQSQLDLERCPHCAVDRPLMQVNAEGQTTDYNGSNQRFWKVYSCRRCGGGVLATANSNGGTVTEMYPEAYQLSEDIPERAREYLGQAINSLHSPAGAVMLSASAIDAMLKHQGLRDGSLYTRIDKAAQDHLITEGIAQWAHQVRLDANDQRHADENAPLPTTEDAERIIEFAKALGQFLYVLPARVRRGLEEAGAPSPE